ncbi:MAG: VanW family protein [Candidatus Parcubacteria bacterium]|nr:VanW family protein [Candidatus Parcubacteria bacterium]
MKILDILGLQKKTEPAPKRFQLITAFFILAAVLVLFVIPFITYEVMYKDKIYSGVYIDGINIGGLNKAEATKELYRNYDAVKRNGFTFVYNNQNYYIATTSVSPSDPDLAREILSMPIEDMVGTAYEYGRRGTIADRVREQVVALINKSKFTLLYTLDEAELKNLLLENFNKFEKPAQDARISFIDGNVFEILPENDGYIIDYDQAINDLKKNINLIAINPVQVETLQSSANVRKTEAEVLSAQVKEILALNNLKLKYQDKSWTIANSEFKNWVEFNRQDSVVYLQFNPERLNEKLDLLAQEINVLPQDAKFVMAENKVTEFKPAMPGLEVDKEVTVSKINQEFIVDKKEEIELAVKVSEPKIKTVDSNTLGIKELIGKGVSDFAGSHTNRILNIKNAVEHLNGIIIPTGEFSIVDAIGEVTAETGYYPEYVIKGDRTIKEYGGGLCQIGTTMFRAALYSGMPITERRPHSYIVSYYKPLGMDATIYGPHPDLRFINDTGNNILLQIKIEGTILTFEFWGTGDNRKIEITDPVLYNWTAQPPDKLIENKDLKPGAKILKEQGRRGADAHFYRYITKADGTKNEEIFRSHYVAWPNIYEVGITPEAPAEGSAEGATNTNINTSQ